MSALAERGSALTEQGPDASVAAPSVRLGGRLWASDRTARAFFIWPALLIILFLSIFPLLVSLYLSLSKLQFVPGRIDISFVGLIYYQQLLFGSEQTHFLGLIRAPGPIGWVVVGAVLLIVGRAFVGYVRGGRVSVLGFVGRLVAGLLLLGFVGLTASTILAPGGRPGTLVVTAVYVVTGITFQYGIGLGLAYLLTQRLNGRRFFRVLFLLPMMITPVGIGYMFRMLTDTQMGPFAGLFVAAGLQSFTWVNDPWGARIAVMIGDIWQWTPFMFVVLLATLEGQDVEVTEAALVDGASRWQVFRHITLPAILPVSTTLVLIRMIEGFKIIDLPNILTNGGPGTATESLTLESYIDWRTLNLGRSAAVAYILLIVVTVVATAYVSLVRRRVTETV